MFLPVHKSGGRRIKGCIQAHTPRGLLASIAELGLFGLAVVFFFVVIHHCDIDLIAHHRGVGGIFAE
jgi:hypothetical protein